MVFPNSMTEGIETEPDEKVKQYDKRYVFDANGNPLQHIWVDNMLRPRKKPVNEKSPAYRRASYIKEFEVYVVDH